MAELKRELNLMDVFCIASGAMISSGLFVLPGLAHAKAGTAVIVSYMLAGLLSLPGMLSLVEMTTAMPKAGGDCFTVIRSLGPGVGSVAGILSWFSLAMKSAFALIGISIFSSLFVSFNERLTASAFCIIFLFINYRGIKEAGRTQVVLVAALLALMVLYIVRGLPAVNPANLVPFAPYGAASVLSTTGFVFVSYAGLLKVASIAGEMKNPGRNIPRGMLLSLLVVMAFYTMMVFVTVGVLDTSRLDASRTPVSDGASVFLGSAGFAAMSAAAILAFLTTANAGIMTSARSLVPLSYDGLLPGIFGKIHLKHGTPHIALAFTGALVLVSVFLRLEILVEAASTVLILTNILACLSLIILRLSRIQNYQPTFRAPLYPMLQIGGIVGLALLILEMGDEALMISLALIAAGLLTFFAYGRRRGSKEYALLHLIEKITAKELTDHLLEAELREIIRERDNVVKDRFDEVVEHCPILDMERAATIEEFFETASGIMAERLGLEKEGILDLLLKREKESSTAITKTLAIPHIIIEGERKFDLLIVRNRQGIRFSQEIPSVNAVFALFGTRDDRNFHLVCLSAIAQIVHEPDFEERWMRAKRGESLRDIVLLGKRKRS